jgi:hypothetical protein
MSDQEQRRLALEIAVKVTPPSGDVGLLLKAASEILDWLRNQPNKESK